VTRWLVLASLLVSANLKAQVSFKHTDSRQGLSNNTVLSILEDKQGFIWISTDDGLNRYDGHSFRIFKPDFRRKNAISHNIAKALFEDHAGNIWIGTDGGGVNKFDPFTEKFTTYTATNDSSGLTHNNVTAIAEQNERYLWIGTYGGGLSRLDRTTQTFQHFIFQEGNPNTIASFFVNSLKFDGQGNLWIGTWGRGLDKLDTRTMLFTHYQHNPNDRSSISDNTVNSIFIDRDKNLWAGTWEGGLNLFDPRTDKFSRYNRKENNLPVNNIRAITQDADGSLWLVSFGEGLTRFDHRSNKYEQFRHEPQNPQSIASDNLWTILYGKNTVWIGAIEGGLSTVEFNKSAFSVIKKFTDEPNPSALVVDALIETKTGDVWAGTFGHGLFVAKSNEGFQTKKGPPLMSAKVTCLLEDAQGMIWIGTDAGVTVYNFKNKVSKTYVIAGKTPGLSFSNVKVIYEDHEGDIWIGTWGGGLNRYDKKTDKFQFYFPAVNKSRDGLADGNIWSIMEDHEGILWIGTNDGLSRFDKRSNRFRSYHRTNDSTSLSDNHVTTVFEDSQQNLWIGTLGGGINLFDRATESFTPFTERDGLANNLVKSIEEDETNHLWIGTNNGLSRFSYLDKSFKNYNANIGIENNSYRINASTKKNNGEMLFGGVNGITAFHPDSIQKTKSTVRVYLMDLFLFDQLLQPGKETNGKIYLDTAVAYKSAVRFNYDENMLGFKFAKLQFNQHNEVMLQYRLEGFDEKWFNVTSPSSTFVASYTNVPPGHYVFKVRGADDTDKIFVSLKVTIDPPFWETVYFRMAVALMAFLALYLIYKVITTRREEKLRQAALAANQKIKQLENENLQQLIDYKNRELANISMNLVQKTKFLSEQIQRLEGIAGVAQQDVRGKLNGLIETMNKEINTEKDWEYFELHFDKVHQNFISKLKQNFPELSATDIRLAALIRIDLSNKEIAELMNRSVRSIESSRYRLRKSLNLQHGDNLSDHLFKL
jgi:ligand-binding sensor domain-containing protein